MALPATLVWEIRPTNGTTNGGGGFDPAVASPGTDFSQQDAVQQAYTDLVIDATTNTDITSAARPFSSTDVGNNISITGGTGFTTGIYNIRSIQTAIIARLDRAVGTTSSTGGTGSFGGARKGFTGGTTTLQASYVSGNKIWVKNEAWNEAVAMATGGGATTPVVVEGYNTARGDITIVTGTANNPKNDRATAGAVGFSVTGDNVAIRNLWVRRAGTVGFQTNVNGNVTFTNCKSDTNGTVGFQSSNGSGVMDFNYCESFSNTTLGFDLAGSSVRSFGCNSHDNTGKGLNAGVSNFTVMYGIFDSNGGTGCDLATSRYYCVNTTSYGNTGASTDGYGNLDSTRTPCVFFNNISSSNGRYGANSGANNQNILTIDFNDYFNNGTAARNNVPVGANDITLDPQFTNAAGGDFSVGTNMKAKGWPGAFPGALTTGYLDIGAAQRQEAGGGSGGGIRLAGQGGLAA